MDTQWFHKNRPTLNHNLKNEQKETYGNGTAGPALLRRKSIPENKQLLGKNKIVDLVL
jgi:hypothetical protein